MQHNFFNVHNFFGQPGPASLVVKQSLHNFSHFEGPRFDPRRGLLSDAINFSFAQRFDGKSNNRTGTSISQPRYQDKKLSPTNLLLGKKGRSQNKLAQ